MGNVAKEHEAETTGLVRMVTTSLARATEHGPVELWRFVLNPQSFGQTVENLFYVSFLVKDGQAKLDIKNGTLLICLLLSSCCFAWFSGALLTVAFLCLQQRQGWGATQKTSATRHGRSSASSR